MDAGYLAGGSTPEELERRLKVDVMLPTMLIKSLSIRLD